VCTATLVAFTAQIHSEVHLQDTLNGEMLTVTGSLVLLEVSLFYCQESATLPTPQCEEQLLRSAVESLTASNVVQQQWAVAGELSGGAIGSVTQRLIPTLFCCCAPQPTSPSCCADLAGGAENMVHCCNLTMTLIACRHSGRGRRGGPPTAAPTIPPCSCRRAGRQPLGSLGA
jgi:hypothetical protein